MMLQDQLYPSWARSLRAFWQSHGRTRIIVFWSGTVILSTVVISLIVSDYISWDYLNREFVATTELSRAFLASFILVMDLLIVMQVNIARLTNRSLNAWHLVEFVGAEDQVR